MPYLGHLPCPKCGSSDAGAIYEDGWNHCHKCKHNWPQDGTEGNAYEGERKTQGALKFLQGSTQDILNRKLREDICRQYGYSIAEWKGKPAHVANYRDPKTRELVAQKVRGKDKDFKVLGNGKNMPLFGQHLWGPGGKSIVITEGEIDALSIAQAFDGKWPVVSVPSGAQSALKAIKQHYEYVSSFEKIVLAFDADEPGMKAALECAEHLPMGKVFLMDYPEGCKDANDVLKTHGAAPLTKAYWNAKLFRPDGVLSLNELRERVLSPKVEDGIPYPWSPWAEKLRAIRPGHLITLTAGSGIGKSTLLRELFYYLAVDRKQPVGLMFLEESNEETIEALMGIYLNKDLLFDPGSASPKEREAAFDFLASHNVHLWDHFGSNDIDAVCNKIRYMVRALGVKFLALDHISILVSGLETSDERKTIDVGMTKLRTLCSELGVTIFLISHLTRPSGDKGHEDGAKISMKQLRGSHSIAQLSHAIIGLEKPEDDPDGDEVHVVCLKNRIGGRKGSMGTLNYNKDTGRLTESAL